LVGRELDRRALITARVLGVRHVLQAVALSRSDGPLTRKVSGAVDLLHAGSMLLLAAWAPGRGRVALTDAAIAALFASATTPTRGARTATLRAGTPPTSGARARDLLDLPPPAHPQGTKVPDDEPDLTHGAAARRQLRAELQEAVHDVLKIAPGRTLDETRAALMRALQARGLAPQPRPWIDAVATDLVNGNIYVVSGPAMQDIGLDLPPHGPI
jgi:hypothetical protein